MKFSLATRTLLGTVILVGALALLLEAIDRAPETYPAADAATTSIAVLRVLHGDLAVGAYSRFGWHHPGPLLYQLFAPLYALSGHREISLKWSALIVNIAALASLLIVLGRQAPVAGCMTALALLPFLYREPRILFSVWNPLVPLLPLGLALTLAAGISAGRVWMLPFLAGTVSFMTQAHVGFLPVSAVIGVVMTMLLAGHVRAGDVVLNRKVLLTACGWSVLVVTVLWLVPLLHEVSTFPSGNLSSLAHFVATAQQTAPTWHRTFAIVAVQLVGPFNPQWAFTIEEAVDVASPVILVCAGVQLLLLVFVAVRAARRRDLFTHGLAMLCLTTSLAGVAAVRSIVGPVYDYLIVWLVVIGALTMAIIAAELARWFPSAARMVVGSRRWLLIIYLVGVAGLGAVRLTSKHDSDSRSPFIRRLTQDFQEFCQKAGVNRPLLRFDPNHWSEAMGIVLQFYKQGRPISVPDDALFLAGEPFAKTGTEEGEFYLMPTSETALPPGTSRHDWVTTIGPFRIVRLFRSGNSG